MKALEFDRLKIGDRITFAAIDGSLVGGTIKWVSDTKAKLVEVKWDDCATRFLYGMTARMFNSSRVEIEKKP